uniref:Peptidase A1 domain-containing protein n=1 Tax=Angiostrongylus cantonensis TaxID=6313 RepID=A0A0K0D7G9_ANGCA
MVDEKFFIIGEAEALALDSFGRPVINVPQHYILRNVDRFERAGIDCGALSNVIILGL